MFIVKMIYFIQKYSNNIKNELIKLHNILFNQSRAKKEKNTEKPYEFYGNENFISLLNYVP